ncbi:MAG TPA: stealth family protein, partial [Micromonosporaceae bacterium]|nr:stealth family protein [Micromonosporaceae bacterium]
PRTPATTPPVPLDSPVTHAAEPDFGQFCAGDDGARFPTRREVLVGGMDWVRFPIDAVYTWVDGSDPRWQHRKNAALLANAWAATGPQAANASRYLSRDELRYSLRSLHHHAPWIRHVHLVTDAQVPAWLADHPWVTVVDHREIFGTTGRTPTFNSHAIESRLHRVPGLAEHFIYLNDDVFLGRPLTPDVFFLPSGIARFFESGAPIEAGPVRPDDRPVMAAGKNNRDVLRERFDRLLTRKLQHTPHPQRRSVLEEIERACPERVAATAAHPFRHPQDLSVPSSLAPYWAYLTGRAVPGHLRYLYTDLRQPETPLRLATLLRHRAKDVFCLNDTDSGPDAQRSAADLLGEFLPAYFPFPAPFEKAAARPRRDAAPVAAPPRAREPEPA